MIDIDSVELDYERLIPINHSYFVGAIQINHPKGFYSGSDLTGIIGKEGDYVLIGSDRKRYVCSKEEFERYYEKRR